ncbi:MAG TPA: hypothetical protein VJA21_32480 [Verrucomicrobiae bacterium]
MWRTLISDAFSSTNGPDGFTLMLLPDLCLGLGDVAVSGRTGFGNAMALGTILMILGCLGYQKAASIDLRVNSGSRRIKWRFLYLRWQVIGRAVNVPRSAENPQTAPGQGSYWKWTRLDLRRESTTLTDGINPGLLDHIPNGSAPRGN